MRSATLVHVRVEGAVKMGTWNTSRRTMLAALSGGALAWRQSAQAWRGTGVLRLQSRSRYQRTVGTVALREETLRWNPAATAITICDMWDDYYCRNAARR